MSFSTHSSPKSYKDALSALNTLQSNADVITAWINTRRLDLQADLKAEMQSYVDRLGLRLEKMSVIHVAGTKGKGSTCAFSESILRSEGYSTGMYTSPHLVSVRERIRINGKPISQEMFSKYFWQCWEQLEATKTEKYPNLPGYFRFLTLLAFKVFIEEKVDVSILEVGVGGRTDATNIVETPVVCGITALGYDHMNVLGNTLTEIAFEKSGIFKKSRPAFTSPQTEEAMICLKKRAKELIQFSPFDSLPIIEPLPILKSTGMLGLDGDHQAMNASMALALSKTWMAHTKGKDLVPYIESEFEKDLHDLSPSVLQAIKNVEWPGRSQRVKLNEHVNLFLDGAHTPESIAICADWFFKSSSARNKILVFNCTNTREPSTLLQPLIGKLESDPNHRFKEVIISTNDSGHDHILQAKMVPSTVKHHGATWQHTIAESWKGIENSSKHPEPQLFANIPLVIEHLDTINEPTDVLITGSLYLVGAWLEVVQNHCPDE